MAAGPIEITATRAPVVDFSKVWANVTLAIVTHKKNSFTSVDQVVTSPVSLGGVRGGASLQAIQSNADKPYTNMWSKIESDPDSKVSNISEGIERATEGNYSLILESQFAEYLVNKHCELKIVDTFLPQRGYAFALTKRSPLKTELDRGIQEMIDDGSLNRLHQKYWNVPCVSGQPTVSSHFSMLAFLLLLPLVLSNQS